MGHTDTHSTTDTDAAAARPGPGGQVDLPPLRPHPLSIWWLLAVGLGAGTLAAAGHLLATVAVVAVVLSGIVLQGTVHTHRASLVRAAVRSRASTQERRVAALVQRSSDAVAVVDLDGTIRYMSPPIEGMLGWTAEEMIGQPCHTFVHPDDLERCTTMWERILADPGATARVDIRHRTRGGSWRLIEGTFTNLLDDPDVAGIVVNERDVTARSAAEARLQHKASRERAINHLGRLALEDLDPSLLAEQATQQVRQILDASTVSFLRREAGGSVAVQSRSGAVPDPQATARAEREHAEPASALAPGEHLSARPSTTGATHDQDRLTVYVPVPGRDGPHGVLAVTCDDRGGLDDADLRFLHAVAGVLALAVQRRTAEDELRDQALHDSLTGLPNRALFLDRLHGATTRAQRTGRPLGVLFLDLDRFKDVNDGFGHGTGDAALAEIADRLRHVLRPGDTVARMGGDEFTVLCEDLGSQELEDVADRIGQAVAAPIDVDGTQLRITASVGVRWAADHVAAEELVGDADAAMYRAKERGRDRVEAFEPAMRTQLLDRVQIGPDLERAMADGELRLEYQPIVDLSTGATVSIEALLRWDDPQRGPIPPSTFVPLAEQTGAIHELGRWVLERAVAEVCAWAGPAPHPTLAVNVSPHQLLHPDLPTTVAEVLARSGLRADRLVLEVTEGAFQHELDVLARALAEVRRLGVAVTIDDFGTGYSSIAYLKQLPVDAIKLDASFVANLDRNRDDRAIATAVAAFGRSLGLVTVAEGIEHQEQADALAEMGFRRAQGFHFAVPAPLARLDADARPARLRAVS